MFRVAAALLVGMAVAWFFVERYVLNVDRYRDVAIAAMENSTGLPASVGRLDLDLFPRPRLSAHDVLVGDGNFQASVDRITVEMKLLPLLGRRVEVTSARLVGLQLRLPKNPARLSKRMNDLLDAASGPSEGGGAKVSVTIAEIAAVKGVLFLGNDTEAAATLSFNLLDILSEDVALTLKMEVLKLGEAATFDCEMNIARAQGEIVSMTGSGNLSGIRTKDLGIEGAPEGTFGATVSMKGPGPNELDFEMNGAFESETHTGLAGPLIAKAAWREDGLRIDEASWTSPDLDVRGGAILDREGRLDLWVTRAEAGPKAMNDLAELVSFTGIRPVASEEARFNANDVRLEVPADGTPRFTSGELSFHGVRLDDAQGGALAEGLTGRFNIEQGLIRIEEFTSDSFSLQGTLQPDFEVPSLAVDLQGTVEIRRAHVAALVGDERVAAAEGNFDLARFMGTFGPEGGVPADLVIEGSLDSGRLDIKHEDYELRLTSISTKITTDSEGIHTTFAVSTPEAGSLVVEGLYALHERNWKGRAVADITRIATAYFLPESGLPILDPLLAKYGQSTFSVEIALPSEDGGEVQLHFQREGMPSLEGQVAFTPSKSGGMQLGAIEAESTISFKKEGEKMFRGVTASGQARITFARDPDTARFEFLADFGQATVRAGEYLEKRLGDTLRLRQSGKAGDTWDVREFSIELLNEEVLIEYAEDGITTARLDVDVGLLVGLLPEGSTAHGAITGEYTSAPRAGRLAFEQVGFTIDSEKRVRSIDGTVEIVGENVAIRDFSVSGVNSECVFAAERRDGEWEGTLKGSSLDLDWVVVLVNEIRVFSRQEDVPASEAGTWDDPFLGEVYIHLDKMYYRQGVVEYATARVVGTDEALVIQDLYVRPNTGELTGTITMAPEGNVGVMVKAELELKEIDARILDEILYDESREVSGTMSGTVSFAAPLGDPKAMMAVADGEAAWSATDGSLGKLGFATKLLTVLKTVEVINLKVPSLRDKGLTFKAFTGEAKMSKGVVSLEDVLLDGGAYELEVKGEVDFAQEKTDVTIHVHVLQSLSNIVEKVPVLGEITKLTTDLVGVTVLMKGSPYDLETVVLLGGDNIFENTKELGEKAIEGVTNVLRKLIPGGEKPENDE